MPDEPQLSNTAFEAVLDAARAVSHRRRIPRQVRENLRIWAEARIEHGADPEELPHLVRGEDDREEQGTAEVAAGVEAALERPLEQLRHALEAGSLDDVLEQLFVAESEGGDRDEVLGAIDGRIARVAHEALLAKSLPALRDELGTTHWDSVIDALWELEEGTYRRKGAFELFEERRRVRAVLDVLDGTVDELRAWLAENDDAPLDALARAEAAGKNRSTALAAIDAAG